MQKRCALLLALAALIVVGSPVSAVIGTIDAVPATTLLLPNFRVDASDPSGLTTLFEINNASAAPAIAHVTLYTNWSIPTVDFNIFLTGYDVVTVNMRDVLNGVVPSTNPYPVIDHGVISLNNDVGAAPYSIADCAGQLPLDPMPPSLVNHIRAWHQGLASPSNGLCASSPTGFLEGYVTIDNVTHCTLAFPGQGNYFTLDYRRENMLWGNFYYVDPANNFAQGDKLVHVETQVGLGTTADYTFYGRFTNPLFNDDAEALASVWAARYINVGAFSGGTDLIVWRDAKQLFTAPDAQPRACGGVPSWWPLDQTQIVTFDEEENPEVTSQNYSGGVTVTLTPFPLETQVVQVGSTELPVSPDAGWFFLNLNWAPAGTSPPFDLDPEMQNWVSVVMSAEGRYSVGFHALQLDNVTAQGNSLANVLPVN